MLNKLNYFVVFNSDFFESHERKIKQPVLLSTVMFDRFNRNKLPSPKDHYEELLKELDPEFYKEWKKFKNPSIKAVKVKKAHSLIEIRNIINLKRER